MFSGIFFVIGQNNSTLKGTKHYREEYKELCIVMSIYFMHASVNLHCAV